MNIIKGELKSKNKISNEEFEELFGNIPFQSIDKIKKYIKKNYISKDKIRELIKEKAKTDTYNFKTISVKDINELLEEGKI